jgi:hypothetical protein
MRRRDRVLLALAAALVVPRPAAAQQSVVLRYQPDLGSLVRTLTEVRTTTTLVGFPAVPDGAAFETELRIGASQRVLALDPDGAVVAVTVDSAWGRARAGTEPWVDRVDAGLVGPPAQAVVSPRFAIVGIRTAGAADADVLLLLGAGAVGLGFAFPQNALAPGESYETGGRVRTRVRTDPATGIAVDEVVFGDLALTLDSVSVQADDTLSHFHFRGAFAPRTAAAQGESGDVVTALSGAYAGRFVWSARWGAFVSGAVRMRVDGRIRTTGPGGAEEAQATWDRVILHSVRP